MKTIFSKLKSRAGESLVESLAAILIFTMSSIAMYSMVSTAGDILRTTRELERQVQEELVAIEKGEATAKSASRTLRMTFNPDGHLLIIANIDIDIYGGQDDKLFTFYVTPETGGTTG